MRIRQLVKKVNKSLGENPKEWFNTTTTVSPFLYNSRGIQITQSFILLKDKWNNNVQAFHLNDKERNYLSKNFNLIAKPMNKLRIEKLNKRRGWLVKEILKTL